MHNFKKRERKLASNESKSDFEPRNSAACCDSEDMSCAANARSRARGGKRPKNSLFVVCTRALVCLANARARRAKVRSRATKRARAGATPKITPHVVQKREARRRGSKQKKTAIGRFGGEGAFFNKSQRCDSGGTFATIASGCWRRRFESAEAVKYRPHDRDTRWPTARAFVTRRRRVVVAAAVAH